MKQMIRKEMIGMIILRRREVRRSEMRR